MLQERVALVTGSTRGIGLGIARALAAEGCAVMLNGFGDRGEIEQARKDLESEFGVRVMHHGANLLRPNEIYEMVEWTCAQLGPIDILVNNAGIQYVASLEEFPRDKWDAILATNLSAAFHTTQYVLPFMRRNNWGRIINIASVHGLVASVNKAANVAAKHGLIGLTKVTALETAQSGITCNAICPGWVRTPLLEAQIQARAADLNADAETGARAMLTEKQPSMEFVSIEHIAQLAVFLCSDAASQITGVSLPIDGGWTAQ